MRARQTAIQPETQAEKAVADARRELASAERALLSEKAEQRGATLSQKGHAYLTGPAAKVTVIRRPR